MPRPIRTKYTIPNGAQYGAPRAGGRRIHQGCDYHCPIGTPIYGTGDGGKVIYIGYNGDPNSGSGNNVVIQYPDGRITTDMHLRERTPLHVGSVVNVNTIVGHVGLTGNAVNADPPGSHDHHQMTLNGKLTDPEAFYGTSTAGNVTPIEQEEEHTMAQIQYYERTGTTEQEWMIAGEEIPGGYEVTLNKDTARIWGRQYSGEGTIPVHVDRDTYIAAQAYWKARAAKWEARQVARIKSVIGAPATGGPTAEQIGVATVNALLKKLTLA